MGRSRCFWNERNDGRIITVCKHSLWVGCISSHRVYNSTIRQKQPFSNYVNTTSRRSITSNIRRSMRSIPLLRRRETNRDSKQTIWRYVPIGTWAVGKSERPQWNMLFKSNLYVRPNILTLGKLDKVVLKQSKCNPFSKCKSQQLDPTSQQCTDL